MTLYKLDFTIPPQTPKNNPVLQKLRINENFIEKIVVIIPPGHRGKAHMHIRYGLDLFAPMPSYVQKQDGTIEKQKIEDLWIEGDNAILEFPIFYSAPEVPFDITVEGYNESEHYSHTFYIYINAVNKEDVLFSIVLRDFVKKLSEIFGLE